MSGSDFESKAPAGYVCPICAGLHYPGSKHTFIVESDIVRRDDHVTALVNTFFTPGNEGHVIVVPNDHYETIYDLPADLGHRIFDTSKMLARAIKLAYGADGINIRQNNEPAAGQHAFHYHMHVLPRYNGDEANQQLPTYHAQPSDRAIYAEQIRAQLAKTS